MTREEAVKSLLEMRDGMPFDKCRDWIEAISMAIRSLEAWDKVLNEMDSSVVYPWDYGQWTKDYRIIKKHLEEVEDDKIH